jgi:hypothetical protein
MLVGRPEHLTPTCRPLRVTLVRTGPSSVLVFSSSWILASEDGLHYLSGLRTHDMLDEQLIQMLSEFEILTANIDRVSECCCYLRVKVNHQASIFCDRVISSLNALFDPQFERILHNSEDYVHNELSGQAV